jgi:hypothetical protein
MNPANWIDLAQDRETGIETLRAHFYKGHAYDPHWHDSYLVGVTEQGVQRFNCRRTRHDSTPGKIFLIEPGEIHDGEAPDNAGFTYRMLYLDPQWLERELSSLFEGAPANHALSFAETLTQDPRLAHAALFAFGALHGQELRIVRQSALDGLLERLTEHTQWRQRQASDPRLPLVAQRARDYLHAHCYRDLGMDELALACGVDRLQGRLRPATPRLPGATAPGPRPPPAGKWRLAGRRGQRPGLRRPEPLGPLVPARLWHDPGRVPQALLKPSRLSRSHR